MKKVIEKDTIQGHEVQIKEHKDYSETVPDRKKKYDVFIDGKVELKKRVNNSDRGNPRGLLDLARRRIEARNFEQIVTQMFRDQGFVELNSGYSPEKDSRLKFEIGTGSLGKNIGEKDKRVRLLKKEVKSSYKHRSMPQRTKPRAWTSKKTYKDLEELRQDLRNGSYKSV
jgi:hypothetical protein